MDLHNIKKIAKLVNSVVLVLVFGLMAFFHLCGAKFLVWFSIPTALVYIVGYMLIYKELLLEYIRMVFSWLTLYMCITTVCLGSGYGFHLYCFSMIPIIFITEYMSYKLEHKGINAIAFSACVAVLYLVCTGYVSQYGPVYPRDEKFVSVFWLFNSLTVLCFLIGYTNYLIRSIIASEEKLKEIALVDRLTGLYNRHYMIGCLDKMEDEYKSAYLAMADIDNFKKINDVYGHNAGDAVLEKVSKKMKEVCPGCTVSRWGGEEFLILMPRSVSAPVELAETLRKSVEGEAVRFEGRDISVTITLGISPRQDGQSIDEWISTVDGKLYEGKRSGKNRVVT